MIEKHGWPILLVLLVAAAGLFLPGGPMAAIADHMGTRANSWLDEVLISAAILGALIILDKASWSLMTSRR